MFTGCFLPAGQQKITIYTINIIPTKVPISQGVVAWKYIKSYEYIDTKHIPAVIKN